MNNIEKKLIAEFIGTFCLVFAGTGAIIINDVANGSISHVGIALTFGLIVMVMIYVIGDISGAHINPAVTLGFYLSRQFPGRMFLPYILSQCGGALSASFVLWLMFPLHPTLGATLPSGGAFQSFVMEFILTWLLMFTILNVSTGSKEKGLFAGVVIGAVIMLAALFAGPVSGASMNPARSFAPAMAAVHFDSLWIYLTAPFLGAYAAVLTCRCVREKGCCIITRQESRI
ncbi:MAG: hypothetical protein IEMM0002_0859 [bacterium]|nr:MAG: hypothetical protein IEMM0002_0859 [bacterium]